MLLSVLTPEGDALQPVILAQITLCACVCVCVCVCVWLAGDRGEQGDKGAKGHGLPGYTGDQGPEGKFIFEYLMLFDGLIIDIHIWTCASSPNYIHWMCASDSSKGERKCVFLPKRKFSFVNAVFIESVKSLTQLSCADREARRLNNIFTSIAGQRGRPGRAFNGQPGKQGERGHTGRPGLRGHPGLRGAPGVCVTSGCAQLNSTSGTPQPGPRRLRNRP